MLLDIIYRVNNFKLAFSPTPFHYKIGKAVRFSTLEAYPELIHAKGAHGYTLLHHAKVGGTNELCDYLKEKGLKETFIKIR